MEAIRTSCAVCNKSNEITAEIATKNFQTLQTVKVWHTTVVLPGLQAGLAKSSIMPVTQGGDELMAKPYPFGPLFHQEYRGELWKLLLMHHLSSGQKPFCSFLTLAFAHLLSHLEWPEYDYRPGGFLIFNQLNRLLDLALLCLNWSPFRLFQFNHLNCNRLNRRLRQGRTKSNRLLA